MYEKLIERLREYPDREETAGGYVGVDWQDLLDAADIIESLAAQLGALQSENAEKEQLYQIQKANAVKLCGVLSEKDKEIERLRLQRSVQVDGDVMALTLELAETKAALSRLEAERDAAKKCIYDIETYLAFGSVQYIGRTIQAWKSGAQGEEGQDG